MSTEPAARARRVGESLREEIASLVAYELKDPKAAETVVTRVEMTNDLRSARVHVRWLRATEDPALRRTLVAVLERASGLLRREVTRRLRLRHAPELSFVYDDGADREVRIEHLLDEIAAERRSRE